MPRDLRVLSVFGTRPEAIKMAPLVKRLQCEPRIASSVCVTGQHRHMLDQVLDLFAICPDYDLDVMKPGQSLSGVASDILGSLDPVLVEARPDLVLVHGDTSTTLCAALAAYYRRIPVGHVEAGLRTGDLGAPFPEEANRRLTATLARLHFAPTREAAANLRAEGVSAGVHVTGNTVIDALKLVRRQLDGDAALRVRLGERFSFLRPGARLVLVTGHRRENLGQGFDRICRAIESAARLFPDADFLFPVHLNPAVGSTVSRRLSDLANVHLAEPLEYLPFVYLMMRAHLVLTDSGGVQEEAPSLGKPVIVMRERTERPEAVAAGTVELVGTDADAILAAIHRLMSDSQHHERRSQVCELYGDGTACDRIIKAIRAGFELDRRTQRPSGFSLVGVDA